LFFQASARGSFRLHHTTASSVSTGHPLGFAAKAMPVGSRC
jgi:hypothetical protein